MLGCILGAVLLGGTLGQRSSVSGIAVGSISLGIVAGWFAFVGYSFYCVFRHGLRDAMSNDRRDPNRDSAECAVKAPVPPGHGI
jgi:hypothetical protein